MEISDDVIKRTWSIVKNNTYSQLISINILEFVTAIINHCAALTVVTTERITEDPHQVLLNVTDNTATLNWTVHNCKSSTIGQMLVCFFCCLLIDSPLGINSEWIATDKNKLADEISCLKKLTSCVKSHCYFDYWSLKQKYLVRKACRFFQPAPELTSMIWDIALKLKWLCWSWSGQI